MGMASTGRCVARDAGGARCILGAGAGEHRHVYAGADYDLGKLAEAVRAYLDGSVDRSFLAATLAEVEADA